MYCCSADRHIAQAAELSGRATCVVKDERNDAGGITGVSLKPSQRRRPTCPASILTKQSMPVKIQKRHSYRRERDAVPSPWSLAMKQTAITMHTLPSQIQNEPLS
jgi:hypothetical protein